MITSKDNPKLKLVRALQRKKERDETAPPTRNHCCQHDS